MSVYIIAQVEVQDVDEYQKYLQGFMPIFEKYDGEVLAIDPETEVVEGEWPYPRTVIIRFPSAEEAHRWHGSREYQDLAQYRRRSSRVNLVLVREAV